MIAVVAAVGREIERDGKALLPGGQVPAVEGVGILGGGEAGILPDGPGLRDVHGGVGAAQVRGDAGIGVEEVETFHVVRSEHRLHRDAFRRDPGSGGARRRHRQYAFECNVSKIWDARHAETALSRLLAVTRRWISWSFDL